MNCLRCGKRHELMPDPADPRFECWADPADGHLPETWQSRARSLAITLALADAGLRSDELRERVPGWIEDARPLWEPLIRAEGR